MAFLTNNIGGTPTPLNTYRPKRVRVGANSARDSVPVASNIFQNAQKLQPVGIEVVENAQDQFSIGCALPQSIANLGLEAVSHLPIRPNPISHLQLIPTDPRINPRTRVTKLECSTPICLNKVVITKDGRVCLLAEREPQLERFLLEISFFIGFQTEPEPYACIGQISDNHTLAMMLQNPAHFGFIYDKTRGVLVRNIQPLEFSVAVLPNLTESHSLLLASYGGERNPQMEQAFERRRGQIDDAQILTAALAESNLSPYCPLSGKPLPYSAEQLHLATIGDPNLGGQIPLPFTKWGIHQGAKLYEQFKLETMALLASYGYHDATCIIIGSSANGFSGNPEKDFYPFSETSDMDIVIISESLAKDCAQSGVPANHKCQIQGKYVIFINGGAKGLHNSLPIGEALKEHQERWRQFLGIEVDFKVKIDAKPMRGISFTL